ncbi:MAG: hypothetical protein ACRDUV_02155 [Pseudonocardiaceae bacterium]
MQRAYRLAARRPKIRFEPGPVTAVGVAVRGQGRQYGLGGAAAEEQLEPASIEQPGVGRHELGDLVEVGHRFMMREACRRLLNGSVMPPASTTTQPGPH